VSVLHKHGIKLNTVKGLTHMSTMSAIAFSKVGEAIELQLDLQRREVQVEVGRNGDIIDRSYLHMGFRFKLTHSLYIERLLIYFGSVTG
jgi:hypothetical protein